MEMSHNLMAAFVVVGLMTVDILLLRRQGPAAFENEKKLVLKGTVTEWLWSNPHCLLQFDVKGDDGKAAHWIGETQNPVSMTNVGWSKTAIKTGDEVTVTILPVKNGMPLERVVSVQLPNGQTLISGEGAAKEVRDELERQAQQGSK